MLPVWILFMGEQWLFPSCVYARASVSHSPLHSNSCFNAYPSTLPEAPHAENSSNYIEMRFLPICQLRFEGLRGVNVTDHVLQYMSHRKGQ